MSTLQSLSAYGKNQVRMSPSTNTSLFISKDQELQIRIQAWKRMSFIVFLHQKDFFLPELPMLQEKLVEAFKSFSNELTVEVGGFFWLT